MSDLMVKQKMSDDLVTKIDEGEDDVLLIFAGKKLVTPVQIVKIENGFDLNDDENYIMAGIILNETSRILAMVIYQVHDEKCELTCDVMKKVQIFMADRILHTILSKKNCPIEVPDKKLVKMGLKVFGDIDELINDEDIPCSVHVTTGSKYLFSTFGFMEKKNIENFLARCTKFFYEINKLPFCKHYKKIYEDKKSVGRYLTMEETDMEMAYQENDQTKKDFYDSKDFEGIVEAFVCTEIKVQESNDTLIKSYLHPGNSFKKMNNIFTYMLGFFIGNAVDLIRIYDMSSIE